MELIQKLCFNLSVYFICCFTFWEGEDINAVSPWDEWWPDGTLRWTGMFPTPILHCFLCNLICKLNLMRAKLNETAAWECALSRDGKPYEYHNMTSSWIDTRSGDQLPPGCSSGSYYLCMLSIIFPKLATLTLLWYYCKSFYFHCFL